MEKNISNLQLFSTPKSTDVIGVAHFGITSSGLDGLPLEINTNGLQHSTWTRRNFWQNSTRDIRTNLDPNGNDFELILSHPLFIRLNRPNRPGIRVVIPRLRLHLSSNSSFLCVSSATLRGL
jgi:hypothetical protein